MNNKEIKKKLKKLGIKLEDFLQITEAYFSLISMAEKYSEKQLSESYDLLKEIMKEDEVIEKVRT